MNRKCKGVKYASFNITHDNTAFSFDSIMFCVVMIEFRMVDHILGDNNVYSSLHTFKKEGR